MTLSRLPDPVQDAPGHSPERLPPLAGNVVNFPRPHRVQHCRAGAYEAACLDQAIAILSESKRVNYQSKQLVKRALVIRDFYRRYGQ